MLKPTELVSGKAGEPQPRAVFERQMLEAVDSVMRVASRQDLPLSDLVQLGKLLECVLGIAGIVRRS